MTWKLDPVKRCRHGGPCPEGPYCRYAIMRHVYHEDAYGYVDAIVEVGPVNDDGNRRDTLAFMLVIALNIQGVNP